LVVVVPVSGGISGIINDVIVIAMASIASYFVSKEVAKTSIKSIAASFSVNDLINIIKKVIDNASHDDELKKLINTFVSNMVKSILSNPDLRDASRAIIKGILEDPEIRDETKKVLNDIVNQYPVLARLLGVNNAKEKKT
jgi:hypothetical protein